MLTINDIKINKGSHFQSSDLFLEESILSRLNMYMCISSFGNDKLQDVVSISVTCPDCDKSVVFKIDKDKNVYIDHCHKGYVKNDKYIVNKVDDICFDYDRSYTYTIKTKSNKFILANDLRKYLKSENWLKCFSVNSASGINNVVKKYSEDNVICVFVGNNLISFEGNKELYKVIDSYDFDEDEEDDLSNFICCDLWWVMSADIQDVDMEKLIEDKVSYLTIDVEENSTYHLIVNYTNDDELGNILLKKV